MDEWRTACISVYDDEANIFTRALPLGQKRKGFSRRELHHAHSDRKVYLSFGDGHRLELFCSPSSLHAHPLKHSPFGVTMRSFITLRIVASLF